MKTTTTTTTSVIVFLYSETASTLASLVCNEFFLFKELCHVVYKTQNGENRCGIMSETIILLCVLFSRNHTIIISLGLFIGFVQLLGFVQTTLCQFLLAGIDNSYAKATVEYHFKTIPSYSTITINMNEKTLKGTQLTIVHKPQIRNHDDVMETERFDGEKATKVRFA